MSTYNVTFWGFSVTVDAIKTQKYLHFFIVFGSEFVINIKVFIVAINMQQCF